MPDLLPPLLTQREAILCQIAELGDMRRGTITEVFRSCGKSGCCLLRAQASWPRSLLRFHHQGRGQDQNLATPPRAAARQDRAGGRDL